MLCFAHEVMFADSNINIQMNYWFAEMIGLGDLVLPLFNYIEVNETVCDGEGGPGGTHIISRTGELGS